MDSGKEFESEFKKSLVTDGICCDRIYDSMGGLKGIASICDFIVYKKPIMLYVELKTVKGPSLPFTNISTNQRLGLCSKKKYSGVAAGFLIKYRLKDESAVFFVDAIDMENFIVGESRKSYPISEAAAKGIRVDGIKKRTKYAYDINGLFEKLEVFTCQQTKT